MTRPWRLVAVAALALATGCTTGGDERSGVSPATTATRATAAPACGAVAPGQSTGTLVSSGVERSYILYVPASYSAERPAPVVLNFHGYGSSAAQQLVYGDFRPLADREGFLLAVPDGQGQPRHFNLLGAAAGEHDDVRFALDLVDELARRACVDRSRVYAAGMSNGGAMAAVLACRASDRFAAVGAVAAVIWAPACAAARPVPIVAFMGTADHIVPFGGGTVNCCGRPQIAPAPDTMANWAEHNRCRPDPAVEKRSPEVEVHTWSGCAPGAATQFFVIQGGGHTWPGAKVSLFGHTTKELDASDALWTFFSAHRMSQDQ